MSAARTFLLLGLGVAALFTGFLLAGLFGAGTGGNGAAVLILLVVGSALMFVAILHPGSASRGSAGKRTARVGAPDSGEFDYDTAAAEAVRGQPDPSERGVQGPTERGQPDSAPFRTRRGDPP